MTNFQGKERRTTKISITFSAGNAVPNTIFKFCPQKTPYRLNENRKIGFGSTLSPIPVVLLG